MKNWNRVAVVLGIVTAGLIAYDLLIASRGDGGDTISEVFAWYSGVYALIPAMAGVICGHWFINNCRTKRNVKALVAYGILAVLVTLLSPRVEAFRTITQCYSGVFLVSLVVGTVFWPQCRETIAEAREKEHLEGE